MFIMLACCCVFTACASCEHEYSTEVIQKPSCEGIGYGISVCTKCGDGHYEFYEALGHDWNEGSIVLPACTQTGLKLYTCSNCGLNKSEQLSVTGHVNTKWQDSGVLHSLYCLDCKEVLKEGTHEFAGAACKYCGTDYNAYLDKFNGTYGYDYLGKDQNGAGLLGLYREIDKSVRAFHNSGADAKNGEIVRIDYTRYGLGKDQAIAVWKTYRDDNPLYYWMSNRVGSNSSVIAILCLDDYANGSVRTRHNKLIYSKIDELLKETCGETNAYNVAFALHDAIINRVDYTASNNDGNPADWAHNICGVLEGKGAVCESYARSFQLLLNACGVENVFVTGNDSNHAWNLVRLDDSKWYWYDLTWDDNPGIAFGVTYKNFCVTDKEFLSSHTPDSYLAEGKNFLYKLPERAAEGYGTQDIKYNSTFTVNGVIYKVAGFRLVTASVNDAPLTVEYKGVTYKVA